MAFEETYRELIRAYPCLPKRLKEEQVEVLNYISLGRNVLAVLPTGFGKSLTYTVPPLLEPNRTSIVVSPLKALMADQVAHLRRQGISAVAVITDMTPEDNDRVKRGDVQVILISPEALDGWLKDSDTSTLYQHKTCLVAVDEVHTLADWGDTFRPSFKALGLLRSVFDKVPFLLLTATLTTAHLERVMDIHMDKSDISEVFANPNRSNIYLSVKKPGPSFIQEMSWYLDKLQQEKASTPKCVICMNGSLSALAHAYGDVRSHLGHAAFSEGVPDRKRLLVEVYHGSLVDADRRRVLNGFSEKESVIRCILCTSAFGMGVDVRDIKYVVVWGAPSSLSELWQHIGRAGRDGGSAEARLLFTHQSCQRAEPSFKQLLDRSKVICIRKFILRNVVYKERTPPTKSRKCCSYCDQDEGLEHG